MLIKKKHKCTNSLMIDLIKLLKMLNVPNVPATWHRLKQTILKTGDSKEKNSSIIKSITLYCPQCNEKSFSSNKCTNDKCLFQFNKVIQPHTFFLMDIRQQIQQILKSIDRNDLRLSRQLDKDSATLMRDIQDGSIYNNILKTLSNERNRDFISLTCNIDGVSVYSNSEQSMWTFTACINELKRSIRFGIEKIIGK